MDKSKHMKIGVNGKQCIGPCYPKNTLFMHPLTLNNYKLEYDACPTEKWINNMGKTIEVDKCIGADDLTQYTEEERILDYVLPVLGITCEKYMKICYNITSFENILDIVTNGNEPYYTNMRLLNCGWSIYGLQMDVFNEQLINFYIKVVKTKWIKYIYPHIAKYISVNGKEIFFGQNDDDINVNKVEKINFFHKKLNTSQNMYSVLKKYVKYNENIWSKISDHNQHIKVFYTVHIIDIIKNYI